jgi:hypothetical protein
MLRYWDLFGDRFFVLKENFDCETMGTRGPDLSIFKTKLEREAMGLVSVLG